MPSVDEVDPPDDVVDPPVDEVDPPVDEVEPLDPSPDVESVSPPVLLDVESAGSGAQNPSTRLQRRPSQQPASSRQARARSPAGTHWSTHTASPMTPAPGSYEATQNGDAVFSHSLVCVQITGAENVVSEPVSPVVEALAPVPESSSAGGGSAAVLRHAHTIHRPHHIGANRPTDAQSAARLSRVQGRE